MVRRMLKRVARLFQGFGTLIKNPDIMHGFLRDEVLSTLCSKVPATMAATIVVATSMVILFWNVIDHRWLVGWFAVITTLALVRIYHAMRGCQYRDRPIEARYRRFRVDALVMTLLWGFAAFFFFPEEQMEYQLLLALIVVGISGGGAITLAIDRNIAQAYSYLPLSALALRFLMCGDLPHIVLFVMTLVFMGILGLSIHLLGNVLLKGIRQNSELDAVRNRLDMILDQTPTGIFYYDKSFRIVDCNQALSDLLGAPKEKLVNENNFCYSFSKSYKTLF
jgi:PAS domain-containing protein